MEPISGAIGIASGAVTLSALALTISRILSSFVNVYQRSALQIFSLIGACKAIEIAWSNIQSWIEAQSSPETVGISLLDQLLSAIEVGKIILGALKQDLEKYDLPQFAPVSPKKGMAMGKLKAGQKIKAVLDEGVFKDHCVNLNLQVSSLHLLLATTALPTAQAQTYVCDCLQPVFRKDEDTAWTIVASHAASSQAFSLAQPRMTRSDGDSFVSDKSFAFTNDLLTAPVYRRLALRALRNASGSSPSTTEVAIHHPAVAQDDVDESEAGRACSIVTRIEAQGDGEKLGKCMNFQRRRLENVPQPDITKIFSSCVHCDVDAINCGRQVEHGTKLLPLHSRLRRERMTQDEEAAINLRFLDAVEKVDLSSLGEALDLGADINASDAHGTPALFRSLLNRSYNSGLIANLLLSYQDLNVHVRDSKGRTALHASVITNRPALVHFLLRRGADLESRDDDGETPLHIAAQYGNLDQCLNELINRAKSNNISIDLITNTVGMTALHVACAARRSITATYNAPILLGAGCSPAKRAKVSGFAGTVSPLYLAIAKKDEVLVHRMLQLPRHLTAVNSAHGPEQCLLRFAVMGSGDPIHLTSGSIVLGLLRAGADYRDMEPMIYDYSFRLNRHYRSKIQEHLGHRGSRLVPDVADTQVDTQNTSCHIEVARPGPHSSLKCGRERYIRPATIYSQRLSSWHDDSTVTW